MRKLFFVVLLVLSIPASAASTNLAIAGYASNMYKSATAVAANGAFTMAPAVSVAGRSVTVPVTARFAANAGQFAVSAIRLNPTALVVGTVLPYLIGKGIEYANGNFELYEPSSVVGTNGIAFTSSYINTPSGTQTTINCSSAISDAECMQIALAARSTSYVRTVSAEPSTGCIIGVGQGWCVIPGLTLGTARSIGYMCWNASCSPMVLVTSNRTASSLCPAGYTMVNSVCTLTNPQNLPVPESKWNEVIAAPLTDAVAQELSRAGVALPVEAPTFSPVDAPLGDPRLDPITGRMVQDRVRITQPNATSTLADVVPYTIDAGNVPQQTTAPEAATTKLETGEAPDSKTDCDKYPNSLACLDASDLPPDENLSTENRPFAVTPVSIGGTGACHADFQIASSHGTFYIDSQPLCNAAGWLKPLILALAYLAAASIISASVREG